MPRSPAPELSRPTRAKIVATLGPASESEVMVERLITSGVSVFRLNFSHGELDEHATRLRTVRRVSERLGVPVAVLGDLGGPKIRVGKVPAPGFELERGTEVALCRGTEEASAAGDRVCLPVTYAPLIDEVAPGNRVLINDGAVRMLAVERTADGRELRCRVTVGGRVTSGKGINVPECRLSVPAITARDWECVHWAVEHNLDFLALSFVREAAEVRQLKEALAGMCPVRHDGTEPGGVGIGAAIPVISKIEKPQAMQELEAIVDASDAIMVARGDLGVEMDIAQVPVAQKRILCVCAEYGKPCIVATQMLETMIESPMPTRAEASDVANAVFDGADAVMLSAETAVGKHPDLVVETMRRIIAVAEARIQENAPRASPPEHLVRTRYPTAALAHGAWHIACDIGAKLVVCWSQSGGTARYLSQNDFPAPVVAYSSSPVATRRMALLRNVTPLCRPAPERLSEFTDMAERDVLERGWIEQGEPLLLLAGKPLGRAKSTNSIATLFVGDPSGGYRSHMS